MKDETTTDVYGMDGDSSKNRLDDCDCEEQNGRSFENQRKYKRVSDEKRMKYEYIYNIIYLCVY